MIGGIQYKIMKKTIISKASSQRPQFCEASEQWLISALDPYHDYQYEVEGLPDERCAPSVVQIHNQTFSLSAPTSAAGGLWDASLLYTGFNSPINCEADNIYGGMVTVSGSSIQIYDSSAISSGASFGALNIWAGAAGATMNTGAPVTVDETFKSLGSVLRTDRCRLIGVAFEVTNTTASIYKQGSVTTALLPDSANDACNIKYCDSWALGTGDQTSIQSDRALVQACTLQPLLSVPGSCTWAAEDGVYAIPRMTMVPRDILSYQYTNGVATNQGSSGRVPILYGTDGKTASPTPVGIHVETFNGTNYQSPLFKPYGPSGFSPLQCRFAGLSTQTVLTVSFRTIVEYFPALTSPLLPLASPSPTFDPKVLAMYSAVASRAPYCVPVGENASGDYFRKLLKMFSQGLLLISPVFGEFAPLALLASKASERISDMIPKREAGPATAQGQGRRKNVRF